MRLTAKGGQLNLIHLVVLLLQIRVSIIGHLFSMIGITRRMLRHPENVSEVILPVNSL